MIIDNEILGILQERRSISDHSFTVIMENDEGLVDSQQVEKQDAGDQSEAAAPGAKSSEQPDTAGQPTEAPNAAEQGADEQPTEAPNAAEQGAGDQTEAAAQAGAPDTAEQQDQLPDEDELIAVQITQTQEVFTKIYLIKHIEQLKKYVDNLISLMEMKYDIDEFDQLKRLSTYIDTLDEIALTLPSETLYQILIGFEFDLLDLITKINKIISVPVYSPPESEAI